MNQWSGNVVWRVYVLPICSECSAATQRVLIEERGREEGTLIAEEWWTCSLIIKGHSVVWPALELCAWSAAVWVSCWDQTAGHCLACFQADYPWRSIAWLDDRLVWWRACWASSSTLESSPWLTRCAVCVSHSLEVIPFLPATCLLIPTLLRASFCGWLVASCVMCTVEQASCIYHMRLRIAWPAWLFSCTTISYGYRETLWRLRSDSVVSVL